MYKKVCDICGDLIGNKSLLAIGEGTEEHYDEEHVKYKLKVKHQVASWHEWWWQSMDICPDCVRNIVKYCKEHKND